MAEIEAITIPVDLFVRMARAIRYHAEDCTKGCQTILREIGDRPELAVLVDREDIPHR
jgi:hypothetical protein